MIRSISLRNSSRVPVKLPAFSHANGIMGNLGSGRHYDPTKNMNLEEMKKKSVFFQDVYLDG